MKRTECMDGRVPLRLPQSAQRLSRRSIYRNRVAFRKDELQDFHRLPYHRLGCAATESKRRGPHRHFDGPQGGLGGPALRLYHGAAAAVSHRRRTLMVGYGGTDAGSHRNAVAA
jgi:hypothetical protein